MKVLFDLLYYTDSTYEGVRIYGIELIKSFLAYAPDIKLGVLCWDDMEGYISEQIEGGGEFVTLPKSRIRSFRKYGTKFLTKEYGSAAKSIASFDICLCTFANDPVCMFSSLVKYVGVVHDLQMVRLVWSSETRLRALLTVIRWRRQYRKFDALVTISKQSAHDIQNFCGKSPYVIYNSIKRGSAKSIRPNNLSEGFCEYILDINAFHEYKNASTLVRAFASVVEGWPDMKLYLKGNKTPYLKELNSIIKDSGVEGRIIVDTENRSEEEINWLYDNASLFVSPSRMEGFGYTPVEAVFHKVPVIVSDIDIFHEIDEDCADYFNPDSSEELEKCIRNMLAYGISKEEKERRYRKLADKFSAKRQVEEFITVLNRIK